MNHQVGNIVLEKIEPGDLFITRITQLAPQVGLVIESVYGILGVLWNEDSVLWVGDFRVSEQQQQLTRYYYSNRNYEYILSWLEVTEKISG